MSIQPLLNSISPAAFVEQHYLKTPYSEQAGAASLIELADWDALSRILAGEDPDVMVARQGRRFEGPAPSNGDAAAALLDDGWTVLVRHAERHDKRLAALAKTFADDFAAPVNIHFYATPGGAFGFGWHYDAEEVFIVQTAGEKEYSLRKNTVNPWPLEETLPADMRYEREIMPLVRCRLAAGDWLYIPCGYWHKADAQGDEPALSLAIGVMAPAAITLLEELTDEAGEELRAELVQDIRWRQKLPLAGGLSPLDENQRTEQLAELKKSLADDLARRAG